MSSIDVSSTAKVSPHHAAARDPPTPFAGDPSCQSRYRVDPVSCSLRISQNTKDSKATSGITGAQRHFVEDLTEKMLSRPWAVQNKCTLRSRDGSDGLSRLTAALLIASFPFEALARDSGGCRVSSINTHCGSQLSSSKSWSTFYRGKCWRCSRAKQATLLCTPSPRTATQTKQRILHQQTHPEEGQLPPDVAKACSIFAKWCGCQAKWRMFVLCKLFSRRAEGRKEVFFFW